MSPGSSCRLPPRPRLAQRFVQRDLQILKINRLGEKIERASIERRADIRHVAVCRHNYCARQWKSLADLPQQREPIHHRHVDVGQHDINEPGVLPQLRQRILAMAGERKRKFPRANPLAELLRNKELQVRLVIDDQYTMLHV